MMAINHNVKMSNKIVVSPNRAVTKTRNAILRMKKCSPELRSVLRQRCQERIHNDRLKILSRVRKLKIQDNFRLAFGNILCEEWKNIEDDELSESAEELVSDLSPKEFNIDEELLWEELLEKELLSEHEDWLLQQYEELLNEEIYNLNDVVCPLCCTGFLKIKEFLNYKKTYCTKCNANFITEKSLLDLQVVIYECLARHDNQCNYNPGFVNVPKSENENNLCVVCHHCSFLNVIV